MSDSFRTLIVPTSQVDLAREIAAAFGPGGVGMFRAALSADGDEPATHYCSTGYIPPQFAGMVPCQYWAQDEDGNWEETGEDPGDPQAVYDAVTRDVTDEDGNVVRPGLDVTLAEIEALFAAADVTTQNPYVAFGRMGIEQVRSDEEL